MSKKSKTSMSAKIRSDMFGASADLPRIVELDISKVDTNPDQPRKFFDDTALAELSQSIKANGLLQPILVKATGGDRYIVVAGERRYRAHCLLSRTTIAAVVIDGDMDEVAIIENVQRENLRPMELAESLGRLMETHAYNQEDAAKIIGKARNTVTELLSLLKLPESIKAQCRTSDIASKSFLIELARMDSGAMWAAWDALKNKGETSVRTVRARKTGELSGGARQTDAPFQKAERALLNAVSALEALKDYADYATPENMEKILSIKKTLDQVTISLGYPKKSVTST